MLSACTISHGPTGFKQNFGDFCFFTLALALTSISAVCPCPSAVNLLLCPLPTTSPRTPAEATILQLQTIVTPIQGAQRVESVGGGCRYEFRNWLLTDKGNLIAIRFRACLAAYLFCWCFSHPAAEAGEPAAETVLHCHHSLPCPQASVCFLASSLSSVFALANLMVALAYVIFLVFGGLLVNVDSIPVYFRWIEKISIFRYAYEAMVTNQLSGLGPLGCSAEQQMPDGNCRFTTGDQFLQSQGLDPGMMWWDLLVLLAFTVFYFTLSYFALLRQRTK